MKGQSDQLYNESLDPPDWEETRMLGHRIVDDILEYLRSIRDRPAFAPIPGNILSEFACDPPPQEPTALADVYGQFVDRVLPYPMGNIHPRFWGWVNGAGTVAGVFADMLAAGMNSNAVFGQHAATVVERQVVRWLGEMTGFGKSASGTLVSGCTIANLTALATARNTGAVVDVRRGGLQKSSERLLVYGSKETHSSITRALEVLGLGSDAFRAVEVDSEFGILPDALCGAIQKDKADGARPMCVVGNAGTVNTAAFDDLDQLADICDEHDLWLHVDGAFGALVGLAGETHLLRGIDRAHSLALDLHKWLHVPFDVGAVLFRDADAHRRTYAMKADYITEFQTRIADGGERPLDYGLQMSRSFRALKVWMTLKTYGAASLGRMMKKNIQQARYLGSLVESVAELELAAPVSLSIVCFRYKPHVLHEFTDVEVDGLNKEILTNLHSSGTAIPSHTVVDGRFVLRAAITNHRTRSEDIEFLVREVLLLGRQIVARSAGASLC